MSSPAKRPRNESKSKQFYSKQARKHHRQFIEVGDAGFLVTCNFKERDSVRECYGLLNEYYKKTAEVKVEEVVVKPEEDDDDIASQLQDQIAKTKEEVKERSRLFNQIDTGVQNLIFIKASIDNVLELGSSIIRDLAETKKKKTKYTLRLLPIETVCKAQVVEIAQAAEKLFDKHFMEPVTFGINFNRRYNNDVSRDEVIKVLANIVTSKNPLNKVNLKEPDRSIIVEIVKGHCLLSVVPDYVKLKKYNVNELWAKRETADDASSQETEPEKAAAWQEEEVATEEETETAENPE